MMAGGDPSISFPPLPPKSSLPEDVNPISSLHANQNSFPNPSSFPVHPSNANPNPTSTFNPASAHQIPNPISPLPQPIHGVGGPSPNQAKSFAGLFKETTPIQPLSIPLLSASKHQGHPAIKLSKEAIFSFAQPFVHTLVGKFSYGRPSMVDSRMAFAKLGLQGDYKLGNLDSKHMLIQLSNEADYNRLYSRESLLVGKFSMRTFAWTPSWRPDQESSLVPIWIGFPGLPIHLFNKTFLFSVARMIGKPLMIDKATSELSRPSIARVLVQLEVLKIHPLKVYVDCGDVMPSFFQMIEYDHIPSYCKHCLKLGHDIKSCRFAVAKVNENDKERNGKEVENRLNDDTHEVGINQKWVEKDKQKKQAHDKQTETGQVGQNVDTKVIEKVRKKLPIRIARRGVAIPVINQLFSKTTGASSSGTKDKEKEVIDGSAHVDNQVLEQVAAGQTFKDTKNVRIVSSSIVAPTYSPIINKVDKALLVNSTSKGALVELDMVQTSCEPQIQGGLKVGSPVKNKSDSELVDDISPSPSPMDWPELFLDGNSSYTGEKHYGSDGFTVFRRKRRNKQNRG